MRIAKRKLAREATICALLGLLIAVVGRFAFLTKDIRAEASVAGARAVRAFAFGRESALAAEAMGQFVPHGFVATKDVYEGYDDVGHKLVDTILFHQLVEVPLTNGLVLYVEECRTHADENEDCVFMAVPSSIEKDYWATYKNYERDSLFKNGIASLYFGMWGFPGGLGIWLLYRLTAFAIRG